jgi:hypothetical protein
MRSPCCLCVRVSYLTFVFYAVRVVSKESRLLVLARTSYFEIRKAGLDTLHVWWTFRKIKLLLCYI